MWDDDTLKTHRRWKREPLIIYLLSVKCIFLVHYSTTQNAEELWANVYASHYFLFPDSLVVVFSFYALKKYLPDGENEKCISQQAFIIQRLLFCLMYFSRCKKLDWWWEKKILCRISTHLSYIKNWEVFVSIWRNISIQPECQNWSLLITRCFCY